MIRDLCDCIEVIKWCTLKKKAYQSRCKLASRLEWMLDAQGTEHLGLLVGTTLSLRSALMSEPFPAPVAMFPSEDTVLLPEIHTHLRRGQLWFDEFEPPGVCAILAISRHSCATQTSEVRGSTLLCAPVAKMKRCN